LVGMNNRLVDLKSKGVYALVILFTVSTTYFIENFLRSAPSALTPILIEELGITHGTMGLVISTYFFIYGVMQIPSGILSDRLGSKKTIILFTILSILGVFLFWVSRFLELLIIAQFLIGIGCSVFYINAVIIVSAWFPTEKQATAVGVLSASSGFGNFISYLGFPLSIELLGGWRKLYLMMSIILVINWIMNIILIEDGARGQVTKRYDGADIFGSIRSTLADKRLLPYLIGYILASLSWVFLTWMPQYLVEARGFTYIQAGQVASLANIGGIPGCIVIGAISDKLKKRRTPIIAFSAAYAFLLFLFLYMPSYLPTYVFAVIAFLISFSISFWVLFFSVIPEILPPEKAGIGLGLINGLGTIGFSLITPLYGGLIDATQNYLISNLLLLVGAVLMTFIFVIWIEETYVTNNNR